MKLFKYEPAPWVRLGCGAPMRPNTAKPALPEAPSLPAVDFPRQCSSTAEEHWFKFPPIPTTGNLLGFPARHSVP